LASADPTPSRWLIRTATEFPPHDGELVFGFAMEGNVDLVFDGTHQLGATDAFVIPPQQPWRLSNASDDFQLLLLTTARLD